MRIAERGVRDKSRKESAVTGADVQPCLGRY